MEVADMFQNETVDYILGNTSKLYEPTTTKSNNTKRRQFATSPKS